MKTRIIPLLALLLGISLPVARAQQQQPIISVAITEIDVIPAVGPVTSFGYNPAVNPGFSQTGNPGVPVNGGNGAYTSTLQLWALATGTFPVGGYTYTFFENGQVIGNAIDIAPTQAMVPTPTPQPTNPPTAPYPQSIGWAPPQPGVYFISVSATDGSHNATSLAVEFFATGIQIVSPVANKVVPAGSSVVIEVASATPFGAISRVDFIADGALIGSSRTYPYSIIYTPPSAPIGGAHFIHAVSYNADGTVAFTSATQGIIVVAPVLPLPTCIIGTPANTTPPTTIPIPDYISNSSSYIPVTVNANAPQGNIQQVELYINGTLFGTLSALPYTFKWQPMITGTYTFTALAYDDKNNVVASTTSTAPTLTPAPTTVIVGSLPSVAITSPNAGATLNGGGPANISASATDTNTDSLGNPIAITQVQFFVDGAIVGTATVPSSGNVYTVSFTPTQRVDPTTGTAIPSNIIAIATDALGFSAPSASVQVTVTAGGSGGGVTVGVPPTINLTTPANMANVVVNTPVMLSASATAPNGNVAQVSFLIDSQVLSTAAQYPYSVTWTPKNLGTYTITAQVTDNLGDKTNSPIITVNVVPEPPPTVTITSPTAGGIVTAGSSLTVVAAANSPDGTIAQVQFFENNISIGTATTAPYSVGFTPLSAGVYSFTAIATDNAGETTTSTASVVLAVPTSGGLGTTIYFGQYLGLTDSGRFAFAVVDGTTGTFIGHSTGGTPTTTYYPDLAVSGGGGFSTTGVSGSASVTGVNGTLTPSNDQFIGTVTQSGGVAVASGFYTGSFAGQATSQVTALVGADGEIMVYVNLGGTADTGDSTVDSTGAFSITTVKNNTITGKVDPATGFLTGSYSGGGGGSIYGARVSGGTFSDGVLKNISTRGQVGTGSNVMIAGFVVGGTASKQLLVRAAGPTLATMGLPGAIGGTQLQIFSGSNLVASNTGWSSTPSNATAVANADAQVGAFAFPAGSADSALVGTFAPGSYTAMISGVGTDTGIALVEAYDLDPLTPFTSKKLVNVSTRGNVGTGASIMIGGFSINGSAPKRLLIRGAGPALSTMGVTGSLTTPHLQLFNTSGGLIRENYSWQAGNDPALVTSAETQTGAFTFAKGSADSAILIVLPPGTYTAQVSGAGSATGVALVEIYEVP